MFLYVLVLAVHVLVSVFLILVVLLQSGKGGDIASAFGGAGSQTVFGPRGTSNVLSKATTWSAGIFMATSLALVLLSQQSTGGSVVTGDAPAPAAPTAPAPQQAPASPSEQNPAENQTPPAQPAPQPAK